MKIKIVLSLLFTFLMSNCSHDGNSSDIAFKNPRQDVYIAGLENGKPCYWKNNIKVDLSKPDDAVSMYVKKIIVDNNDVYVLGEYDSSGVVPSHETIIWKNGQIISLRNYFKYSDSTTFKVLDLEIYNHKLYFYTRESSTAVIPVNLKHSVWENNAETFLFFLSHDYDYKKFDLEVNENGIYTVASYLSNENKIGYFHNTTFHDLSNDFKSVNEIEIQGNSIYVLGDYYDISGILPYTLYKNLNTGIKTTLGMNKYNLRLDNNDVFVTDLLGPNSKIYKNGNPILSLPIPYNGNTITDFKVANGSTYVITRTDSNNNASLFINGIKTFSANTNNSQFDSVFVVNH